MEMDWFNERVPRFKKYNFLYKLACLITGKFKGMTYREVFLIFYGINKKEDKLDRDIENFALARTLEIYRFNHNGSLPESFYNDNNGKE